ncbi:MAG: hypothetical protein BM564_04630 [Bacteroidetes bacterium MedPE-SWsnd-G2]|nr:MAG: hypothetical protein BM564_04630 [Bacteroidetes bacterium MedPE-SWsnd-G2]
MASTSSHKTKHFFFVLVKIGIVLGAFYFMYNRIVNNEDLDFNAFLQLLKTNNVFSTKHILIIISLSVLNWTFEILKWQNLVSYLKPIPFKKAFAECLGSMTASLLTPNRVGEYGAKAINYPSEDRGSIIKLNGLGHFAQMSMTTIFGVLGTLAFARLNRVELKHENIIVFSVIALVIIGGLYFYLKQNDIKVKGYSLKTLIRFFTSLPKPIVQKTFLMAFLKYACFTFQFYYLLRIFETEKGYFEAMVAISSMYFFSSIIPSIVLLEVVVKGSLAVFLFSVIGVDELTTLSIIMLMWVLNYVIPSIIGSVFVLNFKLHNKESLS